MHQPPYSPSRTENQSVKTDRASAPARINPSLGAAVREDSEAMQDSLQKAGDVVAHLQGELTGKAREIAHLKRLLEQSSARFGHLQESITAIRNERHSLANEAMRSMGLDAALKQITAERDRLLGERDGVLQALVDEAAQKHQLRFDKRDVQVIELTVQVINLKRELAEAQRKLERFTNTWNPKTAASENTGLAGG